MKKPAYEEIEKKLSVLEKEVEEYRRLLPELKDSEQKFKLLLNTMPEQFSIYDKDFRIIFTNRYSQKIGTKIGRTMEEELTGRHCYEVWHNRDKVCEDCPVMEAMHTGQIQQKEITTPDGRTHLIYAIALFDENGNVTGTAEYSKDITEHKQMDDALRDSEELSSSIIESMNDGVLVLDQNFHYTHWNRAMERITKISRDELIGNEKLPWNVFPHLAEQGVDEMMRHAMRGEIVQREDIPYHLPNGTRGFTSEVYLPLKSATGKIRGVVGVVRDITERVRAKEALFESEARYRTLVENAPEAIVVLDVDKRCFMDANENAIQLYKLSREDLLKTSPAEMSPEYQPDGRTSDEVAAYEIERAINGETPVFEWTHLDSKGKKIPCEVRLVRLPSTTRILVRGSVIDISERKHAESALRESEARFRSLIQNSNDAIYFLYDGKFEVVNNMFLEMLNITLEEAKSPGFSFMDLVAVKSKPFIEERDRRIANGKEPQARYEFTALTRQGKELEIEASTSYIEYKEGIATLGILRNVTKRKRLEKQLLQAQKMEAIGTLAGGVAHDFNNLLTVINGNAELALLSTDENKNDYLHNKLNSILHAGQKAVDLTSQLLAFSRKQIYKAEIVEINPVISSMDKMLRRLIGEDISIEMVLADNLPKIKADKSQLDQIVINLVVNARDAVYAVSKPGYKKKITIETGSVFLDEDYISKHPGSSEGAHIFIAVSDNGIGMDENTKQRIFDPFFTTKEVFKGTGLGLSTVYGIVKQNKGSIYVYSEPSAGTIFKTYWPVTLEDEIIKSYETKETQNLSGNESILFVEDDFDVCKFATEALMSLGYSVYKASNGQTALNLIKRKKITFDIIITDLIMPELGGKEFVEKIKKIVPDVKVIYASGYTDNHIVHNGMLEEDVNFIQKPYTVKTLAGQVRKVLDNE